MTLEQLFLSMASPRRAGGIDFLLIVAGPRSICFVSKASRGPLGHDLEIMGLSISPAKKLASTDLRLIT